MLRRAPHLNTATQCRSRRRLGQRRCCPAVLGVCALLLTVTAASAQVTIVGRLKIEGTVESVSSGLVVVKDQNGDVHKLGIQDADKTSVPLSNGILLRFPATVSVHGRYAPEDLTAGDQIQFQGFVNELGETKETVTDIRRVGEGDSPLGLEVIKKPADEGGHAKCDIVGTVQRLVNGRVVVRIPRSDFTPKTALTFKLAEEAEIVMQSDDYRRAGPGARVKIAAVKLDIGDVLIQDMTAEVTGQTAAKSSVEDALAIKYRHLSDEPKPPREVRSKHFLITTDISDRQAKILVDKLETMVSLLSIYFGAKPQGVINAFVVRDLSGWPDGVLTEPQGVAKIAEEAGICFNRSLGRQRQAIVYSCDDHGIVQHEATHAYCGLAFGSAGPTWLAEGVAEMGQYWQADEKAVNIDSAVLSYLQNTKRKKRLLEIAVPGNSPSGTWRDYAWRWALCHLLANNPNYAERFKPLAIALMRGQENVSFESVYGPVAKEISFEYALFLESLDNGYRADLCAWQWGRSFKPLKDTERTQKKIKAKYGWQAAGLRVDADESYDCVALGEWQIAQDGDEYDANGDKSGRGKLVGGVFNDYKLSEPFELGAKARFKPPASGDLYLRCAEDWSQLEDNDGEITVHFRLTPNETGGAK